MKKLLQTAAVFLLTVGITFNASAQIPDYGVWPSGVVFTDINGGTHDIDSILDLGHPVFIDAFADWCGPCWTYHQGHALENLYTQYGPGGTDELAVFGIESDPNTPASDISNATTGKGDWTIGVSYPQANDNTIANIINLAYYPTVIKICPDRTVTEVGQKSTSVLYGSISSCNAPASATNDPRLIANKSNGFFCAGGSVEVAVVLQNFGLDPLTSATIEVFDGITSVATKNWTGNLASYEVDVVTVGSVSPSSSTNYNVKITSTNDDFSNDSVMATIAPAPILQVGQTSHEVTFDLYVDNYASEIGFIFDEGQVPTTNWSALYSSVSSNPSSVLGFAGIGSYTDGTNHIQETYTVNNEGCHYAVFLDNNSDGYDWNTPSANIKIKGLDASLIPVSATFEQGKLQLFDVEFVSDVGLKTENMVSNFTLYPNPTSDLINVDFQLQNENNVTVSLMNTVGQTVVSKNMKAATGQQSVQFNTANLEAGIYLVKIKTQNGEQVKRVSVMK